MAIEQTGKRHIDRCKIQSPSLPPSKIRIFWVPGGTCLRHNKDENIVEIREHFLGFQPVIVTTGQGLFEFII
jgi:hypothetical protein